MKKILISLAKNCWYILLVIIALILFIPTVMHRINAESAGERIGSGLGVIAGKTNGAISGIAPGLEDGHNDALKAEDTTAVIKGSMEELGRLQVLKADVSLTNVNSIGDDYKALFLLKGTVTFTVDLTKCRIDRTGNTITVKIPPPEPEIRYDETKTQKLLESQKYFFSGSAKDGYTEYINSAKQVVAKSKESISNYSTLSDIADTTAVQTIKRLAESANMPNPETNEKASITVIIEKEESENGGN